MAIQQTKDGGYILDPISQTEQQILGENVIRGSTSLSNMQNGVASILGRLKTDDGFEEILSKKGSDTIMAANIQRIFEKIPPELDFFNCSTAMTNGASIKINPAFVYEKLFPEAKKKLEANGQTATSREMINEVTDNVAGIITHEIYHCLLDYADISGAQQALLNLELPENADIDFLSRMMGDINIIQDCVINNHIDKEYKDVLPEKSCRFVPDYKFNSTSMSADNVLRYYLSESIKDIQTARDPSIKNNRDISHLTDKQLFSMLENEFSEAKQANVNPSDICSEVMKKISNMQVPIDEHFPIKMPPEALMPEPQQNQQQDNRQQSQNNQQQDGSQQQSQQSQHGQQNQNSQQQSQDNQQQNQQQSDQQQSQQSQDNQQGQQQSQEQNNQQQSQDSQQNNQQQSNSQQPQNNQQESGQQQNNQQEQQPQDNNQQNNQPQQSGQQQNQNQQNQDNQQHSGNQSDSQRPQQSQQNQDNQQDQQQSDNQNDSQQNKDKQEQQSQSSMSQQQKEDAMRKASQAFNKNQPQPQQNQDNQQQNQSQQNQDNQQESGNQQNNQQQDSQKKNDTQQKQDGQQQGDKQQQSEQPQQHGQQPPQSGGQSPQSGQQQGEGQQHGGQESQRQSDQQNQPGQGQQQGGQSEQQSQSGQNSQESQGQQGSQSNQQGGNSQNSMSQQQKEDAIRKASQAMNKQQGNQQGQQSSQQYNNQQQVQSDEQQSQSSSQSGQEQQEQQDSQSIQQSPNGQSSQQGQSGQESQGMSQQQKEDAMRKASQAMNKQQVNQQIQQSQQKQRSEQSGNDSQNQEQRNQDTNGEYERAKQEYAKRREEAIREAAKEYNKKIREREEQRKDREVDPKATGNHLQKVIQDEIQNWDTSAGHEGGIASIMDKIKVNMLPVPNKIMAIEQAIKKLAQDVSSVNSEQGIPFFKQLDKISLMQDFMGENYVLKMDRNDNESKIFVAFDISGSMGSELPGTGMSYLVASQAYVAGLIGNKDGLKNGVMHIVACNTQVQDVTEVKVEKMKKYKEAVLGKGKDVSLSCGGGTEMAPAIKFAIHPRQYVRDNNLKENATLPFRQFEPEKPRNEWKTKQFSYIKNKYDAAILLTDGELCGEDLNEIKAMMNNSPTPLFLACPPDSPAAEYFKRQKKSKVRLVDINSVFEGAKNLFGKQDNDYYI